MNNNEEKAKEIIKHFQINKELESLKINTQGHINTTFISTFKDGSKYTHQRINKNVFKNPIDVMNNILKVTKHIREKVNHDEKRCLEVILTKDNLPYYIDGDNEYWRTYKYIDDVITFDKAENEKEIQSLGKAIGIFQKQLSDFDGNNLKETISNFHDMPTRYNQLEKAIEENIVNRVEEVKDEINFLLTNKERGSEISNKFNNGILPNRVTHNDTKLNNVLFSKDTGEALCVIDLDTIMPGTILFDTGDMIRTTCTTALEDEKDLFKVEFNPNAYKALISSYLEETEDFLTKEEKDNIKESGRTITQIMAVRFLTDYIQGDTYYKTNYKDHNLVRARNQIKLMKSMDLKWEEF